VAANPFSTRFIRPGAIPFLFPGNESAGGIVERLRQNGWRGQIIGPHGSGKSTLLATLKPELEAAGRQVVAITLHQGEHRLPPLDRRSLSATTQIVVDGYEQLSWWSRWRARSLCRSAGAGLLVTAHRDRGLPTIYRTEPSEELVRAVVARLLGNGSIVTSTEIAEAYQVTGRNVREALFKLYDVYQAKERRS
jgi:hypothetical protein